MVGGLSNGDSMISFAAPNDNTNRVFIGSRVSQTNITSILKILKNE